jgi:hypothetical protein
VQQIDQDLIDKREKSEKTDFVDAGESHASFLVADHPPDRLR